jgi:hypothetical protein
VPGCYSAAFALSATWRRLGLPQVDTLVSIVAPLYVVPVFRAAGCVADNKE